MLCAFGCACCPLTLRHRVRRLPSSYCSCWKERRPLVRSCHATPSLRPHPSPSVPSPVCRLWPSPCHTHEKTRALNDSEGQSTRTHKHETRIRGFEKARTQWRIQLLLDLEQLRSHLTAVQDAADKNYSDDADHHNQSDRDDLRGLLLDIPASSAANTTTLHTQAVSQSAIAQVLRERERCPCAYHSASSTASCTCSTHAVHSHQ